MSQVPTAKLLNTKGRVTLHRCVRLVIHETTRTGGSPVGRVRGIYPIFKCQETGTTRISGCLELGIKDSELSRLFPNVPVVQGRRLEDRDEQAA